MRRSRIGPFWSGPNRSNAHTHTPKPRAFHEWLDKVCCGLPGPSVSSFAAFAKIRGFAPQTSTTGRQYWMQNACFERMNRNVVAWFNEFYDICTLTTSKLAYSWAWKRAAHVCSTNNSQQRQRINYTCRTRRCVHMPESDFHDINKVVSYITRHTCVSAQAYYIGPLQVPEINILSII